MKKREEKGSSGATVDNKSANWIKLFGFSPLVFSPCTRLFRSIYLRIQEETLFHFIIIFFCNRPNWYEGKVCKQHILCLLLHSVTCQFVFSWSSHAPDEEEEEAEEDEENLVAVLRLAPECGLRLRRGVAECSYWCACSLYPHPAEDVSVWHWRLAGAHSQSSDLGVSLLAGRGADFLRHFGIWLSHKKAKVPAAQSDQIHGTKGQEKKHVHHVPTKDFVYGVLFIHL